MIALTSTTPLVLDLPEYFFLSDMVRQTPNWSEIAHTFNVTFVEGDWEDGLSLRYSGLGIRTVTMDMLRAAVLAAVERWGPVAEEDLVAFRRGDR